MLLLLAALATPADTTKPTPTTILQLEQRIEEILTRTHIPGLSIAIVTRDSVLWTAGIGLADVKAGRPATSKTLFRIGSTSKAFTALAALQLQQEGKLSIEDPLSKYIPEIKFTNRWESTDPVRIVNALEHTTGFDDWAMKDIAFPAGKELPVKDGLDFNPDSRVSRWRPGTRQTYSNSGPPLVAYVLEKLEHKPFEQIIQERLFDPIGMRTATYFYPDTTKAPMTVLYRDDGVTPFPYWYVHERPAGSINASAEDMAQYVRFLLNRGSVNGKQLLPPEAIARAEHTERSSIAKSGLPGGYGLHLSTYVDHGYVWSGHDGGVPGGVTNMAYIPGAGIGYSFSTNAATAGYAEINDLVRAFVTRNVPKPEPPPRAPISQTVRREFLGWYKPDAPRNARFYFAERATGLVHVTDDDSSLTIKPVVGKGTRFVAVDGSTLREPTEAIATLAFHHDPPNGRADAMERMGYLLPASYTRISTLRAWVEIALVVSWLITTGTLVLLAAWRLVRFLIGLVTKRPRKGGSTGLFWWPLAGVISLLVAGIAITKGLGDPLLLGRPTAVSVAFFLALVVFAICSVAGTVRAIRRDRLVSAGARRAGLIASALNLVVVVYLAAMGVLGWRPWS